MNKQEFLLILGDRLVGIPEDERKRTLDYYAEIIDDRMEEGVTEAEAILSAALAGVPIVATTHASTLSEVTARPAVRPLLRAGVFHRLIGLCRTGSAIKATVYPSPYQNDGKGGT